jgi:hypothetical protein
VRLFHLERTEDVTGVSGTGTVAQGVEFDDGSVAIRWAGATPSTVIWASIDHAMHVHGHGGLTRLAWDERGDWS